jgi:outer membrane biosynthesis protein TonB
MATPPAASCIWHNRHVRAPWSLLIVGAIAVGTAGCAAHPQARTQPEVVPLDVPVPPARTIAPPPLEEPPPAAAQPPDSTTQKPARPRPAQPKTEPPPQPPPVPPPAQQTTPPATSPLQTTPPANQAEMANTIRELLKRARRDLEAVKKDTLNADGKAQYDTASRFADQAEQALKDMNLVFAMTLADKAATLARSLAGRF